MEALDLLSSVDLFSQLGPSDINVLAEHSEIVVLSEDEILYESGTTKRELFVIDSGSVRITRVDTQGKEVDLARFVAGESFGEQDFVSTGKRAASAVAERQSSILVFPRRDEALDQVMFEHPEIFARVMHRFLVITAGRIRSVNSLVSENSTWIQELRQQVFGDKLTGLYSKTFLDDEFEGILDRTHGQTGFLMVKPDNFKLINDTFGHEVGDQVLRIFANQLKSLLREQDIAVRYRGNEFAVIMPGSPEEEVLEEAERIQTGMEGTDLSKVTGETRLPITFSVGVSIYPDAGVDYRAIVTRAHELVFVARDAGGHQVLCANCLEGE
ncbi:MAG: diguanylate cyclase [Spirochaetales bacterium]